LFWTNNLLLLTFPKIITFLKITFYTVKVNVAATVPCFRRLDLWPVIAEALV